MSELSTVHRPFGRTDVRTVAVVRLRCHACDVAWTGALDSSCWVCEEPGVAVNRLLVRTDPVTDALEEFDLLR
ncbi:MAG: hypothetical protein MUE34_18480 [Acidimicrobiales bacterium]|nr:hypothetical protein [Acidimicrobiales bacterium]